MGKVQGVGKVILKRPVFLLGFMAVGKSTVGPLLAQALGVSFLDLDESIEKEAGLSIPEIFQREGEEGFRIREGQALREILGKPIVVATGGGIVTREENWGYLQGGITVALVASPQVLRLRLGEGEGRPLFDSASWEVLLSEREPLYKRAQVIVDTTCIGPWEVVEEILEALNDMEDVGD